jgi:uncharacterized protein YndB with AHSA1/START domain
MLVRKPVETVFGAFLDPNITSNFWFSKGSGRLDKNKEVLWTWEEICRKQKKLWDFTAHLHKDLSYL